MSNFSKSEIINWQNDKLKLLINHSYHNTEYYKKLFDDNRILPSEINSISDLKKIPPLTKEIIKNNYNKIIPKNISKYNYKKGQTGGSTAEPLRYLQDLNSWSYCNASVLNAWGRIGYKMGKKYMALGSRSINPTQRTSIKHRIYYFLKGKISYSAINLDKDSVVDIIKIIKNKNIKYLYGYSSALFLMASHIEKNNIKPPNIRDVYLLPNF